MKCPYCAEEIQDDAKKCRHCGEWIGPASNVSNRGSTDARAIARGLKQKEFDDWKIGCLGTVSLGVALVVGVLTHWLVGLIIFIILAAIFGRSYWKE